MKGIALGSEIILHISSTQEMSISRLRETAPVNSLDPYISNGGGPIHARVPIHAHP